MTIQGSTVCNLIQTFPVLLILAQKQNKCLETHFVYKPPTPTQSPDYYMALDALFQNLYGHEYPGHDSPCYYSSKYGTKPCHGYSYNSHGTSYGSHGIVPTYTNYGSHGTSYGSHGTSYGSHGTGYGLRGTKYGSHGTGHVSHSTGYGSYGTGYGTPGVHFVPSYTKGNMYSGNITYGHRYASTQGYTSNNRYKIVVKKTKIGTKRKGKSGKYQAGLINGVRETVSDALGAVSTLIRPQQNRPFIARPTGLPNPTIVSTLPDKVLNSNEGPVSNALPSSLNQHDSVSGVQTTSHTKPAIVSTLSATDTAPNSIEEPINTTAHSNSSQGSPVVVASGGGCKALNGAAGECIRLPSCQLYMRVINTADKSVVTWILSNSHCGFDGPVPKVCCPIDQPTTQSTTEEITTLPSTTSTLPPTTSTLPPTTSTLPPSTSTMPPTSTMPSTINLPERPPTSYYNISFFSYTCTTVYNTIGACKDLYQCLPFMALLKTARSNPTAANVLRLSHCGFKGKIPQVCCPLPNPSISKKKGSTALPSADTRTDGDFITALPEPPFCGLNNYMGRVVGGAPAKLGAFPCMALLGYRDESISAGVKWKCGGVLISNRHVLTAAHCIHNQEDDLFLVRLGELDLSRDDDGATPVDVPIKAMYKHESYTKNIPVMNDVGILVLEKDVEFTDFIQPICLFSGAAKRWRSETFEDYEPFVAGWGNTKWNGVSAAHLQVAQLPVLSAEDCVGAYSSYLRSSWRGNFSEQSMCAGFMAGKIDSCTGDSGGPLMLPINVDNKNYIYAIGVVSFGRRCALAGSPGVYARVSHFMPWIEEKVLGRTT